MDFMRGAALAPEGRAIIALTVDGRLGRLGLPDHPAPGPRARAS